MTDKPILPTQITPNSTPYDVSMTPYMTALADAGVTPKTLAMRLRDELDYKEPARRGYVLTPAAMRIRQAARQDAQKLLDLYPVERKQHDIEFGKSLMDLAVQVAQKTRQGTDDA